MRERALPSTSDHSPTALPSWACPGTWGVQKAAASLVSPAMTATDGTPARDFRNVRGLHRQREIREHGVEVRLFCR
jgi:hypothetical protein